MRISIRPYETSDATQAAAIWNQVVEDGVAFPQEETLGAVKADAFFKAQSYTGIAHDDDTDDVVGLYILHPNNVGRCGHIANASYAVRGDMRGQHIGERLVKDCLCMAHELGFRILQFNAVVASNVQAIHLYERLGFERIGEVPGGFRLSDGSYEDIVLFYHET